jgi:hypothetical protein
MSTTIASILMGALVTGLAFHADPGYRIAREIAIGGEGGWDYVIADAAAHRLYVSHATKIVVADTGTGAIVGEIPDTPGVHGFAIAPELGRGFTSNGRANSSTIVDLRTLKALGTVHTGANPDSIRYLAGPREVWTFNHSAGSITAFHPETGAIVATIEVGGQLEEAVEDATAGRVYVNVEDRNTIAVVDVATHMVIAHWPIAGCEAPTGLAFDQAHHRLLAACDKRMVVVDSASGKAVTSFPIGDRVDGNGFDPATGLAFASSGTGVVTIAHEETPDRFTVVQTVTTQPSGRTMFLDPVTHRVYVPVALTTSVPNGRARVTPGTMKVLVLAPQP